MTLSARQLDRKVQRRLKALAKAGVVRRIWDKDATVWGGTANTPELGDRLGWLTVAEWCEQHVPSLEQLALQSRAEFDRVLLLGMGGSSLAAEVLARSFGRQEGYPTFDMLDSPHPAAVMAIGERSPVDRTLFVVSSKSGTTVETMRLYEYFSSRVSGHGAQFVAVTDPGTPLERLAVEREFRAVFSNPPDVGGRFAALSLFGMVPAALIGLDVRRLLEAGQQMANACRREAVDNPGASLGVLIGEAALAGRDKLTLALDPTVRAFGLWTEQLVAESTGKNGRGVLPVPDEDLGEPPTFANDRLFVGLGLAGTRDSASTLTLRTLEEQGHPVQLLEIEDRYALGGEFFRWQFATAVAGALIGVNPFDQPNVAEAKENTERLLATSSELKTPVAKPASGAELRSLLDGVQPGDYLALLAYMAPSSASDRRLVALQRTLRDRLGAAVTMGYGPRYLHSTGQLHKGGPPKGHFIQIVDSVVPKLPLPEAGAELATLTWAQAAGDYEALRGRGRPVAQVTGLDALEAAVS